MPPPRRDTSRRAACRACHDVAHVGELALEEEGDGVVRADHVVSRLRLRLGGELRHELQVRDGVHAHADARLLAERFRLLAELVVEAGTKWFQDRKVSSRFCA